MLFLSIRSGYLKYLNESNYNWKTTKVCARAASSGHLDCLRYVTNEQESKTTMRDRRGGGRRRRRGDEEDKPTYMIIKVCKRAWVPMGSPNG